MNFYLVDFLALVDRGLLLLLLDFFWAATKASNEDLAGMEDDVGLATTFDFFAVALDFCALQ